jgi:hypothetical protein
MPASPELTGSSRPWGRSPGTAALPFANVESVRLRREQTIRMAGHPPGWSIDRLQFPTDRWSVLGGLGELASQRRGTTGNLVPLAVIARNRGLTAQHADNNHLTARVLIKVTIALNHFKTLFNQFSDVNVRNRTIPGQTTGGQLHRPLCRFCATPFDRGAGVKPEFAASADHAGGGQVKRSMDAVGIRPAITRNGGNDAARRDGRPSGKVRPGQYPGGAVPFW